MPSLAWRRRTVRRAVPSPVAARAASSPAVCQTPFWRYIAGAIEGGTDGTQGVCVIPSPINDASEQTIELRRAVSAQAVAVQAGSLLAARYQIEARIGEGGSGQVFRAWDRVLGEPIALKILRPDRAREKSWTRRLAREVKVARAIRHPNVCRVFDLGSADGHWFVSMELASGGSLRDALRQEQRRPFEDRVVDARSICAGLAAIHAVGIIHRDVTPHNILRMADGRLVLSDFGLAVEGAETSIAGGTPSYLPPETAMGERADQRSDVWQLGFVLHEVLFGRRPEWRTGPQGMRVRKPAAAEATEVERELARLCLDCLAVNPADRPASAIVVAARLAAAELARPRLPPLRAAQTAWAWARRHRWATIAIACGVLGAAAGAIAGRAGVEESASDRVWNEERREAARRALGESGAPGAKAAFEEIDRLFTKYLPRR